MHILLLSILLGQASAVDGDTIRVDELKVRIWGLDAPELGTQEGIRAKAAMFKLVEGKDVRCEPNGDISYDRVVAKCFVGDKDIAAFMIEQGVAKPYCRFAGNYYNEAARVGGKPRCNL